VTPRGHSFQHFLTSQEKKPWPCASWAVYAGFSRSESLAAKNGFVMLFVSLVELHAYTLAEVEVSPAMADMEPMVNEKSPC
jgi:hypothetical protein